MNKNLKIFLIWLVITIFLLGLIYLAVAFANWCFHPFFWSNFERGSFGFALVFVPLFAVPLALLCLTEIE